jgi:hypothetical protein
MRPDERRAAPWGPDDEARLPSIDELLGTEISQANVREQARHLLGIGPERVTYRPEYPGTRQLREDLGI